jgi:hypothetical protein
MDRTTVVGVLFLLQGAVVRPSAGSRVSVLEMLYNRLCILPRVYSCAPRHLSAEQSDRTSRGHSVCVNNKGTAGNISTMGLACVRRRKLSSNWLYAVQRLRMYRHIVNE